jgi:YidC/Oxa1 family membrane protein insertase
MTFFFLTFPSGLVLYWLTNNVLSIAQQYYINKAYDRYKAGIKASGHPE